MQLQHANGKLITDKADVTLTIKAGSVAEAAARLYGQGFRRPQIARALLEYLTPNSKARNDEQRLSQARAKLRRWELSEEFRNMVHKYAVVKLDMETPQMLMGLSAAAKKGRVDAVKLALEITGRHTSREDQGAPIQINIAQIPRPDVGPEHAVTGGARIKPIEPPAKIKRQRARLDSAERKSRGDD